MSQNIANAVNGNCANNEVPLQEEIVLISSDGELFRIERSIALQLQTIANSVNNEILLENVNSVILAIVIKYCRQHVTEGHSSSSDQDLKNWDSDFMKTIIDDQYMLFNLCHAANYLGIKTLFDLTCQAISDTIVDATPDQIRSIFIPEGNEADDAQLPEGNEADDAELPEGNEADDALTELPEEMLLEILARLPSHRVPVLSLVSKKFRRIVLSRDMIKLRRRVGRDSILLMFTEVANLSRHWFSLTRTAVDPRESRFVSTAMPHCPVPIRSFLSIGHLAFVVCGSSIIPANLWVYNHRTNELLPGPPMQVELIYKAAGMVCNRIFLLGIGRKTHLLEAQVFDINTGIWTSAPLFLPENSGELRVAATASVDKKIYCLSINAERPLYYDSVDGNCGFFHMFANDWWIHGTTVIDNTLFVFYHKSGLMWYDADLKMWSLVTGLDFDDAEWVAMSDFHGMIAFFWIKKETTMLFCKLISVNQSTSGYHGVAEPSHFLRIMPCGFHLRHCFTISG